jgi:vacuolar-type H+-ATPase subunit E/Vma4
MSLERLRASFLALVSAELAATTAAVEAECRDRVTAAQADVELLVAEARAAGTADAADEARRLVAEARRHARGEVLNAQHEVYQQLRSAALAEASRLRGSDGYRPLLDRLAAEARSRLGADATIELDPDPAGGVVARDGLRVVDCSLPALANRCLDRLGPRVAELWQ